MPLSKCRSRERSDFVVYRGRESIEGSASGSGDCARGSDHGFTVGDEVVVEVLDVDVEGSAEDSLHLTPDIRPRATRFRSRDDVKRRVEGARIRGKREWRLSTERGESH